MTKEELLDAMNAKIGQTNLSARTIEGYAEQMSAAMGAEFQMTDDFVDKQLAVLKSVGGQLSHDISSGIEAWKQSNHTESKPIRNEEPKPGSDYENLEKKVNELLSRLDGEQKARSQGEYRSKLLGELKVKLGEQGNAYLMDQVVNHTEWDTSKPIDAIIGEVEQSYNREYKKCFGDGPAPRSPQGNGKGGKEAMNARKEAFLARLKANGSIPTAKSE